MVPQYESEKDGKCSKQNGQNRLQMVQFECPRHWAAFDLPPVLSPARYLYIRGLTIFECQLALLFAIATRPA